MERASKARAAATWRMGTPGGGRSWGYDRHLEVRFAQSQDRSENANVALHHRVGWYRSFLVGAAAPVDTSHTVRRHRMGRPQYETSRQTWTGGPPWEASRSPLNRLSVVTPDVRLRHRRPTSHNLRSHEIAPRPRPRSTSSCDQTTLPVTHPSVAWADFVNRWSLRDIGHGSQQSIMDSDRLQPQPTPQELSNQSTTSTRQGS